MLRRRIQVHLQRPWSMEMARAAPSCIAGAVLRIPSMGLLQCYSRPDPPAAMLPSWGGSAPLPRRRRETLDTTQLRDVMHERTRAARRSSPRWRWPAASCRCRRPAYESSRST